MNKVQRNCVADHLSDILRKMERLEDRLYAAEENGNSEDISRLSARIEKLSAELKGADSVLAMLGYVRHHHDDENGGHYTIEKI